MHEYFKPWWRKAGCVVLVITSVLAGIWMRSYLALDFFEGQIHGRMHTLGSLHGYLIWRSWDDTVGFPRSFWQTESPGAIRIDSWLNFESDEYAMKGRTRQWAIQYAWILAPLTALCAYLLLWPSRRSKIPVIAWSISEAQAP